MKHHSFCLTCYIFLAMSYHSKLASHAWGIKQLEDLHAGLNDSSSKDQAKKSNLVQSTLRKPLQMIEHSTILRRAAFQSKMNERIDFVCVNKDCDFCKSAEKVRSVYRTNIPPSCFECDAPLQEATPASTSGEDIPDASDKLKMCCKSAVVQAMSRRLLLSTAQIGRGICCEVSTD